MAAMTVTRKTKDARNTTLVVERDGRRYVLHAVSYQERLRRPVFGHRHTTYWQFTVAAYETGSRYLHYENYHRRMPSQRYMLAVAEQVLDKLAAAAAAAAATAAT